MTAHTSGPWVVLVDDDTGRPLEIVLESDHNKRVAFPTSDGPIEDARLIAAAPDPLAALHSARTLVNDLCTKHPDDADRFNGVWASFRDEFDAAIAKAEGREP